MLLALLMGVDGCSRSGTAVGNPGPTKPPASYSAGRLSVGVEAPPDGVALSRADLSVADLQLLGCSGDDDITAVSATLDLLSEETLPLRGGVWCGLLLTLEDDALVLEGQTTGGIDFSATLDPGTIARSDGLIIDGQDLSLTLPADFLTESEIESAAKKESTVDILPEDEIAGEWAEALEDSALTGDMGSGDGAELAADGGEKDCGCAAGARGGWWWLVGLVLLSARRRSYTPDRAMLRIPSEMS